MKYFSNITVGCNTSIFMMNGRLDKVIAYEFCFSCLILKYISVFVKLLGRSHIFDKKETSSHVIVVFMTDERLSVILDSLKLV